MTNYDNKEKKVLVAITKEVEKLDRTLNDIDLTDPNSKETHIKKWYAEKKATHEIKRILHEASLYEKYEDDEMQQFNSQLIDENYVVPNDTLYNYLYQNYASEMMPL